MASSLLSRGPTADVLVNAPGRTRGASGNLLVLYGRLLGPLLGGYLLLDKAFAYIRLPGTPVYVGEMVLAVGALGVLAATGYLRIPVRDEPILAVLAAFFLWGFIRFLPGFQAYGIWALRDFALCYYCLFAFFTVAALARAPDLLDRWLAQLARFVPWLLIWLPLAVALPKHAAWAQRAVQRHLGSDAQARERGYRRGRRPRGYVAVPRHAQRPEPSGVERSGPCDDGTLRDPESRRSGWRDGGRTGRAHVLALKGPAAVDCSSCRGHRPGIGSCRWAVA